MLIIIDVLKGLAPDLPTELNLVVNNQKEHGSLEEPNLCTKINRRRTKGAAPVYVFDDMCDPIDICEAGCHGEREQSCNKEDRNKLLHRLSSTTIYFATLPPPLILATPITTIQVIQNVCIFSHVVVYANCCDQIVSQVCLSLCGCAPHAPGRTHDRFAVTASSSQKAIQGNQCPDFAANAAPPIKHALRGSFFENARISFFLHSHLKILCDHSLFK